MVGFQFKGKPFTTRQLMDIWFNAEIFHSNQTKIVVMEAWAKVLASNTARSMLFMSVYDSILIIRNINWSVMEFSKDNMYLRMRPKAVPANYQKNRHQLILKVFPFPSHLTFSTSL